MNAASIEKIKDDFRACLTVHEVDLTARKHARPVVEMGKTKATRPQSIQIKNLANYMRTMIRQGIIPGHQQHDQSQENSGNPQAPKG